MTNPPVFLPQFPVYSYFCFRPITAGEKIRCLNSPPPHMQRGEKVTFVGKHAIMQDYLTTSAERVKLANNSNFNVSVAEQSYENP